MHPFVVRYVNGVEMSRLKSYECVLKGLVRIYMQLMQGYHITCYETFTSERNIKAATRRSANPNTFASEVPVEAVVSAVRADTDSAEFCRIAYFVHRERGG